jgi:catechol 2,3-dioxygenase-like lactoylglutathione lyase family enzyme
MGPTSKGGRAMAEFRMIVSDVDAAVAFYTTHLGFELVDQFGPAMAITRRDDLTLWLAGPAASASRPMPDGAVPSPGGWNRFVLITDDLAAMVARLRTAGVTFRNDIVKGPGGQQILVCDPSGNVVELFQPA